MRYCEECRGELGAALLPHYEDDLMGVPVRLIGCVEQVQCKRCGPVETTIPDLEGLTCAVAVARVKVPVKLTGAEIRFIRKALDLTARGLADALGVTAETVSRWENGREPIGVTTEKLLRLIVGLELSPRAPGIDFDEKEIGRMTIRSVASVPVVLSFERILMRVDRKKETVWENAKAA